MNPDWKNRVFTCAVLGYSVDRISRLLGSSEAEVKQIAVRLITDGDELCESYRRGRATGEYNIDVEVAKQADQGDIDAIELRTKRAKERRVDDLKQELFGI